MDAMLQDMITKPARLVWTHHGLPPDDIERLTLGNAPDPLVNSPFKLGTAAQTAVGLSALAAAHLYALRTGIEQNVHVEPRHAIIEFNSENYYTINGTLPTPRQDDELTGVYQAQDGWIRLNTNFPKDKAGVIELLQCEPTRKSVDEAIKKWSAFDFIDLAMKRGFCAAGLRSFESIDNHQQGKSTVNISPVTIERIGDAPRRPPTAPSGSHPLSGIRVIEMTRVLAGPLASRTLAAHGADVLSVSKPGLPRILEYDIDTNRGKRMTQLDLDVPDECNKFNELLRGADVFVQCYRPGSLDKRGLGAKDVAKMRPGIVHASLSAFAHTSLYKGRTGYEEEVQFVGGYAVQEAESYKEWFGNSDPDIPAYRAMPMSAISHLAGQFLAFGIMTALSKTVTEGGSWEVHVSLESVALWLRHLGLLTAEEAHNEGKPLPERLAGATLDEEVAALSTRVEWDEGDAPRHLFETAGSTVTAVRHAAELEATPVRVGRVPKGLGVHDAKWLPRD